jgi:hypothetical protein
MQGNILRAWHGGHFFVWLLQLFSLIPTFFGAHVGRTGVRRLLLLDDYTTENKSVEGLIDAQRKLLASPDAFDRIVGSLLVAARLKVGLSALSDQAVGQLGVRPCLERLGCFQSRINHL